MEPTLNYDEVCRILGKLTLYYESQIRKLQERIVSLQKMEEDK